MENVVTIPIIWFAALGGIFGLLVTMVGWFITRTIRKIDKNQSEIFKLVRGLSEELYQLKGEHESWKQFHLHGGAVVCTSCKKPVMGGA